TLCLGIAFANLIRVPALAALALVGAVALAATPGRVVTAVACIVAILGWWWGSARLDRLDHSVLRPQVGRAERALVVVTAAPRRGRFDLKMPVRVRRFGALALNEPAQLELPLGRAPPRGAILEVRAEAKLPRGPSHGFHERTWLPRHGIHAVPARDTWRVLAHRRALRAVGPQPSVLRAGVAGALGSLAWLTARSTDRWYCLLLGGLALLAWNPYAVFDAGFQLSFAAVVAIFVLAPRIGTWLEGYPLLGLLREPVAISTACGAATAPILWFQFHAIPLLAVPANAAAAPA